MSKSTVLLTFENDFLFTLLCTSTLCPSEHINDTQCTICNFYAEDQACKPHWCITKGTFTGCIKRKYFDCFMHPVNVPFVTH